MTEGESTNLEVTFNPTNATNKKYNGHRCKQYSNC